MKLNGNLQRRIVLLIAAFSVTGRIALADDVPTAAPENDVIVIAKADISPDSASDNESGQETVDSAVQDALQTLLADNKLELDLRLSGHKSVLLAADQ